LIPNVDINRHHAEDEVSLGSFHITMNTTEIPTVSCSLLKSSLCAFRKN
jgi:hypothetical protein